MVQFALNWGPDLVFSTKEKFYFKNYFKKYGNVELSMICDFLLRSITYAPLPSFKGGALLAYAIN